MAVLVEAREIAVRDYSPDYGTVKQVEKGLGGKIKITFVNGTVITPDEETEILIDQGGRF
jgi:hypothetical protein